MKSDIEIAREINLKPITSIAKGIGIPEEEVHNYGKYMAKIPVKLIDEEVIDKKNLILVTAITPTKAGIGKTTVSIGLSLGLSRIGKKTIVALREPSLGPCFGMKGGAAGGGYAQILPMENINLHFTGDFHAITSSHNMISALLDNYIYQNRKTGKALKEVLWKRVMDINDRSLRYIITGLNGDSNGLPSESGFDITPASEIMAILCLSKDLKDLKRRIENIILGYDYQDKAFTVKDLGVAGAITVLLKEAINPNLVQTTENSPAIVHGGPFANIAHGCNSVIATKAALTYADYVITEAGFGADLGAEKFFNIKCRKAGLNPKLTVIVITAQALKMLGGIPLEDLRKENIEGIKKGFKNMDKHIQNMKSFGQNIVIAFNQYSSDTSDEINLIKDHCSSIGVGFAVNNAYSDGGKGAEELAKLVVNTVENSPSQKVQFTYTDNESIKEKIEKVAKNIYGASNIEFSNKANKIIERIKALNIEHYPICIAKTQYSFSDSPEAFDITEGFSFTINDIVINNGAEFIVAVAGTMLRMPGLPKEPQAKHINIIDGNIEGLS